MIGVIPASGKATRFNGLPKFSLPCDAESTTVIKRQVDQMKEYVDKVVVSTSSKWYELVKSFELDAEVIIVEPSTMNDAVLKIVESNKSNYYIIGMADTYFKGENPYKKISESIKSYDISIACWKINDDLKGKVGQVDLSCNLILDLQDKNPECEYQYMWGSLGFNEEVLSRANKNDSHLGMLLLKEIKENFTKHNAFKVDGEYFDIGSMVNYKKLLNSLEI